jgi:hypothetical protein
LTWLSRQTIRDEDTVLLTLLQQQVAITEERSQVVGSVTWLITGGSRAVARAVAKAVSEPGHYMQHVHSHLTHDLSNQLP